MKNIYNNISFVSNWHYKELCDILQAEVERMLRGEPTKKNFLINLPIRCGKTMLISEICPVWLWVKDSSLAVMSICATQRLATKSSRMSKLIITSTWFQSLFPEIQLAVDNKSKSDYSTNQLGSRQSFGVDSTIIGSGFDVCIIDDPNSPSDSQSETALRNVRETYQDVISGRANNDWALTIILQQRTSENDLCGFLLKKNASDYRHLCIPAVLNKNTSPEFISFYEDDLFFPKRYGLQRLEKYQRDLTGQAYASQLLQQPSALEGSIILRQWFKICKQSQFQLINKGRNYLFVDTAYTDNPSNCPNAFCICTENQGRLYIIKSYEKHLEFYESLEEIKEIIKTYNIRTVYVERKATGESILQELKRQLRGSTVFKGIDPGGKSKMERARAIQPHLQNGRVILVEDLWNEYFLQVCAGFPFGGKTKDMVDTLVYAVLILIAKKKITDVDDDKVRETPLTNQYERDEFNLYD